MQYCTTHYLYIVHSTNKNQPTHQRWFINRQLSDLYHSKLLNMCIRNGSWNHYLSSTRFAILLKASMHDQAAGINRAFYPEDSYVYDDEKGDSKDDGRSIPYKTKKTMPRANQQRIPRLASMYFNPLTSGTGIWRCTTCCR